MVTLNEFNYIGILLNRTGNFNKVIKKQEEKTRKAVYEVFKRGRMHNLSNECQIHLFNKMVKPILLYGTEIWGFSKSILCLGKVQLKFCKLLLKLKSSIPNYMIHGKLGIMPMSDDIKVRMISFLGMSIKWKRRKKIHIFPMRSYSNYIWKTIVSFPG